MGAKPGAPRASRRRRRPPALKARWPRRNQTPNAPPRIGGTKAGSVKVTVSQRDATTTIAHARERLSAQTATSLAFRPLQPIVALGRMACFRAMPFPLLVRHRRTEDPGIAHPYFAGSQRRGLFHLVGRMSRRAACAVALFALLLRPQAVDPAADGTRQRLRVVVVHRSGAVPSKSIVTPRTSEVRRTSTTPSSSSASRHVGDRVVRARFLRRQVGEPRRRLVRHDPWWRRRRGDGTVPGLGGHRLQCAWAELLLPAPTPFSSAGTAIRSFRAQTWRGRSSRLRAPPLRLLYRATCGTSCDAIPAHRQLRRFR